MPIQLYGQKEFAEQLGWSTAKFAVYWGKKNLRNPIPEPYALVGNRPAWTLEQVEEYKKTLENKEE
jgi:hypothetical protein